MKYHRVAAVLFLVCLPSFSRADEPAPAPSSVGVSANLLGVLTLNPTLDVEATAFHSWTVGVTAWWEVRAVEDRWGQVRIAYYPWGTSMQGLGLAVTGGLHRAYRSDANAPRIHATSPTVGALAGYDFRLGKSRGVRLGLVGGIKTTLANHDDNSPLRPVYAEARVNLGWVF